MTFDLQLDVCQYTFEVVGTLHVGFFFMLNVYRYIDPTSCLYALGKGLCDVELTAVNFRTIEGCHESNPPLNLPLSELSL